MPLEADCWPKRAEVEVKLLADVRAWVADMPLLPCRLAVMPEVYRLFTALPYSIFTSFSAPYFIQPDPRHQRLAFY